MLLQLISGNLDKQSIPWDPQAKKEDIESFLYNYNQFRSKI